MKQYIVDAFADKVFEGNPAAVCVMDKWLDDALMQKISLQKRTETNMILFPELSFRKSR